MAGATFAMAAASGLQALMYLSSFGANARTDGFFAAFALYAVAGVFTQSLRVTVSPLIVGSNPRLTTTRLMGVLGAFALAVMIVAWPLAPVTASILAPGLHADARAVTASALPILGVAVALQLFAAGAATVLTSRDAFGRVAGAYAGAAAAGLVSFVFLRPIAGELCLAWSMLVMAAVTLIAMAPGGGVELARPSLAAARGVAREALHLLTRTAAYLVFYGLWLVTLAAVGRYEAGAATVLSYAYLFTSYLVAGTGVAIGQTRVADMARDAASGGAILRETVPSGFRYALLVCAPAMAGLILLGSRLAGDLFPASLDPIQAKQLARDTLLLYPWCIFALLVTLLLPPMYALGRVKCVNVLAGAAIVAQVAITALGASVAGADGAVAAAAAGSAVLTAGMLLAAGRETWRPIVAEVGWDATRFTLLAFGSFGVGALFAAVAGRSTATLTLGLLIGGVLYVAGLVATAPKQFRMLLHGGAATNAPESVTDAGL